MENAELFQDCTEFEFENRKVHFVRFHKETKRVIFWEHGNNNFVRESFCKNLPFDKFPIETLKDLDIWDKLSPEEQEEYESKQAEGKKEVVEKMAKARSARGRKVDPKYAHLPSVLEYACKTCGAERKQPRSAVILAAEKKGLDVEKFMAEYECQKCNPTKGRGRKKKNPKYANLPEEMVCKCGYKTRVNVGQLEKKAAREKTTVEKLIKNYKCQTCNPTKGRRKK